MMGPGVAQTNGVTGVSLNSNNHSHSNGMPGGGVNGVNGGVNGVNGGVVTKACAACGGRISDRFLLHAMDRYWHTACLKCSCCGCKLGDIGTSCFTKAGMILCRDDYVR